MGKTVEEIENCIDNWLYAALNKCASLMKVRKFRAKKKDYFHDCRNFVE